MDGVSGLLITGCCRFTVYHPNSVAPSNLFLLYVALCCNGSDIDVSIETSSVLIFLSFTDIYVRRLGQLHYFTYSLYQLMN